MTTTAFHGGPIRRLPGGAIADWLLVEGGTVTAVGSGEPPPADRAIDLQGATLLPAFCDAHVHLPVTGLVASALDFRNEHSVSAIQAAFAARAGDAEGILFGANFEDPLDRTLTRRDLDKAVGDRPALLARADLHSCIVSSALLQRLEVSGLEGVDRDEDGAPTGYLRERAASAAWALFDRSFSPSQQREAVHAAVRLAYSRGVACVHEMFVVEWRGWPSLGVFLESVAEVALRVITYVGTDQVSRVKRMGFPRIGGDFFLDGSFGSHTAWLTHDYSTPPPQGTPPRGIAYRSDGELFDYFRECQAAGLQVGVHAIGDAAIDQALSTWEKVAAETSVEEVAALGHRIEHFECASDDHLARAARLGLRASVQPAFDRFWGGSDGLYAKRIGWTRAARMNRFATMLTAGLLLGVGSDTTVTPLDPFLQLAALREHHVEDEQLGKIEALRLHTSGARALAEGPGLAGTVEAGAPADLVVVDRDPAEVDAEKLLKTEVIGTWAGGRRVYPDAEAETP